MRCVGVVRRVGRRDDDWIGWIAGDLLHYLSWIDTELPVVVVGIS